MRVMDDVFHSYIDQFVIVYLDDILIFSSSWEVHIKHVKQVLEILQREKLYLKMSKCEFQKTSLVYLGYNVEGGQLKIDPTKVEVIVKWPRPQNVIEVRSFLGAVQYWRKFIANFSFIASPLHALTNTKVICQWRGKQEKTFDTLKQKIFDTLKHIIITTPVLALPDIQQPFEIETDASGYAMGALLMQRRKPICFH